MRIDAQRAINRQIAFRDTAVLETRISLFSPLDLALVHNADFSEKWIISGLLAIRELTSGEFPQARFHY